MRCRHVILALTVLAPAALPAQGTSASQANAEKEVRAVITRMFDGMRAGDSTMVRSTLHPEARMVRPMLRNGVMGAQIDSPHAWVKAIGTPHAEAWDERISNVRITIDGNLAHAWMDFEFWRGSQFSHCGVDSMHLIKLAEGWKVVDLADTSRKDGCKGGS